MISREELETLPELTKDDIDEIILNRDIVKRFRITYQYNIENRWCKCCECEYEKDQFEKILGITVQQEGNRID